MRLLTALVLVLLLAPLAVAQPEPSTPPRHVLVIHGGAGVIERGSLTPEREAAYREKLEEALRAGYAVLQAGGSALDAAIAAVRPMEDSELFNAGRGAVFTAEGEVELDASVMDGATLQAGAVTGIRHVRNPILAARMVMERSRHVMLSGAGADAFAAQQGLETVENDYFYTERRREALRRAQERERERSEAAPLREREPHERMGTVGAVALDQQGRLAAATSTGGTTNKRFGRIGDSPIIGAGTYADARCGVSATGTGEYFIRLAVAHAICARVRYLGESIDVAASAVIHGDLTELEGDGGVIALDADGNVAMPFNTAGMYRGYITADGTVTVEIYGD